MSARGQEKRWCDSCDEQAVPIGPHPVCANCGSVQEEPFRAGWDESD